MDTLSGIWSEYWWILPLVLMILCVIGCGRARKAGAGCCCHRRRGRVEGPGEEERGLR